jgi:MoxR-like ATPase
LDYDGFAEAVGRLVGNVERAVAGKREEIFLAVVALLAGGHILIEDVPGVGKTLLAKSLARSIAGDFRRIQFTPDLLPTDVTGLNVYKGSERAFEFWAGPVFANVVLAELDRFMVKMALGYPDGEAEIDLLRLSADPVADLRPVVSLAEFVNMCVLAEKVYASEAVLRYVVSVTSATRKHEAVYLGASPRASRMLLGASKAYAAVRGRSYCIPDDVKALAPHVLSHRIIASPDTSYGGVRNGSGAERAARVVREILSSVPVNEAV